MRGVRVVSQSCPSNHVRHSLVPTSKERPKHIHRLSNADCRTPNNLLLGIRLLLASLIIRRLISLLRVREVAAERCSILATDGVTCCVAEGALPSLDRGGGKDAGAVQLTSTRAGGGVLGAVGAG